MTTSMKKNASRKICTLPEDCALKNVKYRPTSVALSSSSSYSSGTGKTADISKLIKFIDENIVGRNVTFLGPFGRRKVVYCDYTASGRALQFIEDYIVREVLPLFGDTRTSINVTAHQSALFRQEAYDIVRHAVNVSNEDVVVFTGNNRNSALEKLIQALELVQPPIVFVGSSEHHVLLLPWIEVCAKVVRIAETKEGFLDLVDLENKLQKEKKLLDELGSQSQFIGCFSAASDVTGILADDIATTILLHQFGAHAFWDYSTAAPYVQLDMNPLLPGNDKGVHKDAIFFSGQKFIGGVQSSSVLVAKTHLFKTEPFELNRSAECLVSSQSEKFLQGTEVRKDNQSSESTLDTIRIGLAMHLKQTVGPPTILTREQKIAKTVLSFIRTIPEIILLGNGSHMVKRLPIFSFVVRHPRGVFLHHNFVCAILNDVFGIQACGGCACTGQYAHDLLGIDPKLANLYEEALVEDKQIDCDSPNRGEEHFPYEILRPGFTRISLPYFISDAEVTFILEAVKMVATEGWKLLPQYVLYPEMGEWKHRTNIVFRERKWLSSFRFIDGKMAANERKISGQSPFPQDPADCLQMARNIFNKARKMAHRYPLSDQRVMFDESTDKLRWFMLPSEAQNLLLGNCQSVKTTAPFTPGEYNGTRNNSLSSNESISEPIWIPTNKAMLDVSSSMYCRHNSLTSFETGQLKKNSSFFVDKARSDCGCLSPYRTAALRKEALPRSRTRCYSLESTSSSPPSRMFTSIENGHCSCGSQTDISDAESNSKEQISGDLSDLSDMGIHTLFPAGESENLQAYVKGVTEELATEIKTEIRDVIAKVDNVLSESMENLEMNSLSYDRRFMPDFRRTSSIPTLSKNNSPQCSLPNLNETRLQCPRQASSHENGISTPKRMNSHEKRSTTPSCDTDNVGDQVAVYLAELTSEMVTEMKSELREMVNAVDEIISPSLAEKSANAIDKPKVSSSNAEDEDEWESSDNDNSQSQTGSISENVKLNDVIFEMKEIRGRDREETKSLSKSDSSSDSGVAEIHRKLSPTRVTKRKVSVVARETRSMPSAVMADEIFESPIKVEYKLPSNVTVDRRKRSFENVNLQPKWHCPPKNVWKPTVEAIREFDMIREGDRILICLSGGKDSLALLHTLHQYQYYSQSYGINFTFGALTIDPENLNYDPRPLIPYLSALGVNYLYEKQRLIETEAVSSSSSFYKTSAYIRLKRSYLYKIARENNYNVVAIGQHLDDMAEIFLMSIFHEGRLYSIKAHNYVKENDVRVIRPFIFVREKHLRQFTENRKLPMVTEHCPTYIESPRERYRAKQLLAQQEILNPKLFVNLKSALQPLIGVRVADASEAENKPSESDDDDSNSRN